MDGDPTPCRADHGRCGMRLIDADAMRQDWLENVWDIILRLLGIICVSISCFCAVVVFTSSIMFAGEFFVWVFGLV